MFFSPQYFISTQKYLISIVLFVLLKCRLNVHIHRFPLVFFLENQVIFSFLVYSLYFRTFPANYLTFKFLAVSFAFSELFNYKYFS